MRKLSDKDKKKEEPSTRGEGPRTFRPRLSPKASPRTSQPHSTPERVFECPGSVSGTESVARMRASGEARGDYLRAIQRCRAPRDLSAPGKKLNEGFKPFARTERRISRRKRERTPKMVTEVSVGHSLRPARITLADGDDPKQLSSSYARAWHNEETRAHLEGIIRSSMREMK